VPDSPSSSSVGLRRPLLVWAVAVLVYIGAIAGRAAFGVSSVQAADRFEVAGTALSLFGVVQLGSYAIAQIPAGLLLDRLGARRMLVIGALVMAAGHTLLALGETLPVALTARTLTGIGDAATFISAVRLTATWFPSRLVPLFTQLTSVLGQLGQVVAAVPFFAVLLAVGWTAAWGALALFLLVVVVLSLAIVRDRPEAAGAPEPARLRPGPAIREIVRSRAAWAGLFTHWLTLFPVNAFFYLWGVPYLTLGQGLESTEVSFLLTLNVAMAMLIGPGIGVLTGRMPQHRVRIVWVALALIVLVWAVTLLQPQQLPVRQLVPLMAALALGTGTCAIAFDLVRTGIRPQLIGTATGFCNIGGFGGALLAVLLVGVILDLRTGGGTATLADYRLALGFQVLLIAGGAIGLLVTLRLPRGGSARRARATGPGGPDLPKET
jgi:nitrate/nitrite transporter NarK